MTPLFSRAFILAFALALPAGAGFAPASAQPFLGSPAPALPPPAEDDPEEWEPEGPGPTAARHCQKMCENDESPCDPISYKLADGRCEGIESGW